MPTSDVDIVESKQPGFLAQRLATNSSYINARLRKRYGNSPDLGSSLPLGRKAPVLVSAGTLAPEVRLTGVPTLGCLSMRLEVTLAGVRGTAQFRWSSDGGHTFSGTTITTAATVTLGATGLTALFADSGPYATDNVYQAATPVPEVVLGWLTAMTNVDMYRKRGVNPQDPTIEMVREECERALAELKEAADSKDGLFDLPACEDADSAITTGGPLAYSETSPYVWTDIEACNGSREDGFRFGR